MVLQEMADQTLLTQTLSEFAATLVKGFAVSDVLHDLAERVTTVLGVDSAGVSVQESGRLCFITALDERSATLEQAQERAQAGPCLDAWRSGAPVTITDLREGPPRWGSYDQVAHEAGIVAVAGIPMRLDGGSIGALDLYSAVPREWSPDDLHTARVLADMATSYVINASELDRQRRINRQLQDALDSRIIIEQAKGVLAAELGISVDKAFDLMRHHARDHNANLRAVAQRVVNLGLRP
jgi:GAF domain-containing protein